MTNLNDGARPVKGEIDFAKIDVAAPQLVGDNEIDALPALDADAAISFLHRFCPEGPWALTAIGEGPHAPTATFTPGQEDALRRWLKTQQNERRNIYFLVGEPKKSLRKKAKKTDMARARWLWVDVDARKDLDWRSDVAVQEEMDAIQARIEACPVPPTVIVASGGGFQAFWRLSEPFELGSTDRIAEIEALNKALADSLGGDHCHNADRIMRLPGTVNFPNAKKRAAGREPALARLVAARNGAAHVLDAFDGLKAVVMQTATADSSALSALPRKLQRAIRAPETGDRSKAFFAACCALFEHGLSETEAVAAFEAEPAGVGAKFIERGDLAKEVATIRGKWRPKAKKAPDSVAEGDGERATQADMLISMAREAATLFSTPDGTPHATITISGVRQTWPLKSKQFKFWLIYSYLRQTGKAPNSDSIGQAALTLNAIAMFEGEKRDVYLRRAEHDGKIYLDLCDDRWRAIEIDTAGWRVVDNPPVSFIRRPGMLPLPEPVRGGSIDELRPLLNMKSEDDFRLTVAWLLASLRPTGPYPLMALVGEQGTAKTSTAKLLRSLVDPHVAGIRRPPKEERDLWISASNSALLAFDNLSAISEWLSDSLCVVATGGSYTARELRTDGDEAMFTICSPVLITSIGEVVSRSDLADRAVMVTLARIPDTTRLVDRELKEAVERARPRILGVLLDGLSRGLAELPNVKLGRLPRMADFVQWTRACEIQFWEGGAVQAAFQANSDEAVDGVIEGDAVSVALLAWFDARTREPWVGTTGELLTAINAFALEGSWKEKNWPRNPQALRSRLTMAAPSLYKRRIAIERGKTDGARWLTVSMV
jgi:hypothetical protein